MALPLGKNQSSFWSGSDLLTTFSEYVIKVINFYGVVGMTGLILIILLLCRCIYVSHDSYPLFLAFPDPTSPTGSPMHGRKTNMRKSIKNLFTSAPKFQKSLKRWVCVLSRTVGVLSSLRWRGGERMAGIFPPRLLFGYVQRCDESCMKSAF